MNPNPPIRRSCPRAAAIAILLLAAGFAPAIAQSASTVGRSEQVSTTVTVMAVDAASRHLLVQLPDGKPHSLKVAPQVRGFNEVKPGDKIVAHYFLETAYAVSEPGKPLPEDTQAMVAARAAKGEAPAAVVTSHVIVTGAVLAIDVKGATLKVVSPKGGEVHDFDVVTAEGQKLLAKLKVGDKITAYVTEALLVSLDKG